MGVTSHRTPASGASVEEAEAFLRDNPDIDAIDVVLVDCNGIGRGKMIRKHELLSLYQNGRHFPTSVLGVDVVGEDVDATGLIWDVGDADRLAWPIPGTLAPLTWTAPARAQVLVSLFELDGSPMLADPRHAMCRQIERLGASGLRPAGAFELEFFLFAAGRGPDGRPQPARAALDGRASTGTQVYGLEELDGMEPLFADIYAAAKAQRLPLETLISEYAPGQYELTLHYRGDLARAADDLVMLKRLVRAVARRHRMTACFMAKPSCGHAGSGMHLHLSLTDSSGRNVFAEQNAGEVNETLRNAIGGLLSAMPESMIVFAPHANSWRRLASRSYAPIAPTWGFNNRSVAVRVPPGPVTARRFEHRVAGVDANPYLVAAAVLAGLRQGFEARLEPGPAVEGDGYEQSQQAGTSLPPDWRAAIVSAKDSEFLKDALGNALHRAFVAIKESELLRFTRTVSELDYRLYLELI